LTDRLAQRHGGYSHVAFGDGRVALIEEMVAAQPERSRPIVRPVKLPPREVPR
jgi:prepilin-type processing-associated H-X9-DG protein